MLHHVSAHTLLRSALHRDGKRLGKDQGRSRDCGKKSVGRSSRSSQTNTVLLCALQGLRLHEVTDVNETQMGGKGRVSETAAFGPNFGAFQFGLVQSSDVNPPKDHGPDLEAGPLVCKTVLDMVRTETRERKDDGLQHGEKRERQSLKITVQNVVLTVTSGPERCPLYRQVQTVLLIVLSGAACPPHCNGRIIALW
ncbi:hypothetical protein WMY93_021981 [Mugilogobius chulae]|uniref:Uncharacterized protein n=1 Tax=Mugilogobius chulae TaxID=88201 RepID=A0AAW0NHX7_9GOBI